MSNIEEILFESYNLGIKDDVFKEVDKLMLYKKYYNLNHYLAKNYDFILDTTSITAQEAIDKTLHFLKKPQNSGF